MSTWYEDQSFWIATYPFMFSAERLAAAAEEMEQALRLIDLHEGTALDLCCGPGRSAVALAKHGLQVTGVDREPFLLDKARARALAEGVEVEWVQQDMRDFVRPNSFDFVLSMFTSFGFFEDPRDDLKVLGNVLVNLKPGATFLIDLVGKERMARILEPTSSEVMEDGTVLVERREIVNDWTRVHNEWILIKDDRARSFTFRLRIYSGQELKDRLEQAGFQDVALYGSLDGTSYDINAQRLIAVARKPEAPG